MQDYSFDITPNLPPPDQSANNSSAPGQPTAAGGTSTTTGSKNVSGATSGVDAPKGAITATGANSLIIDQNADNLAAPGTSSDTNIENAEHVFSTCPQPDFGIDYQTQYESLGKAADLASGLSSVFNNAAGSMITAFPSDVNGLASSESTGGQVTTNASTEPTNSTGSVTTDTTTTTSNSTETSPPPPNSVISMTQIMAELGGLESQQSATMAQQQTSEIDAISLQASYTDAGAAQLKAAAGQMMTMAGVALGCSLAGSAYQMGGISSASKAGDDADMASMDEKNEALENASEASLHETKMATSPEGLKSNEASYNTQKSINHLKQLSKNSNLSEEQKASYNQQAEALNNALEQSKSMPGGSKKQDVKDGKWTAPTAADGTPLRNSDGSYADVSTPEKAGAFYNEQARSIAAARPQRISYSELAKQGIRPGQTVSDEDAEKAIGTNDPAQVKAFQDNVANLKVNRNSSAWQEAYKTSVQNNQIYSGTIQAFSGVFNSAGEMQNQIGQADNQEDQAAAQVEGSTEQAMSQGVQQTQSLADSIRQSQTAVAQDMSSMVSSTRV